MPTDIKKMQEVGGEKVWYANAIPQCTEDGVDSPRLVKRILILDNPYGHENLISAVIKMRVDYNSCFNKILVLVGYCMKAAASLLKTFHAFSFLPV